MKVSKVVVAFAVSSMVFAACGSGSLSAEEKKIAENLAAEFETDGDFAEFADAEAAECIANGMVKTIGVDRFEELGVTADEVAEDPDFTEDEEKQLISATFDCLDAKELLSETGGVPEEIASCVVDEVGEKDIKSMMEAAALGEEDESMEEKMEEATTKCVEE